MRAIKRMECAACHQLVGTTHKEGCVLGQSDVFVGNEDAVLATYKPVSETPWSPAMGEQTGIGRPTPEWVVEWYDD